MQKRLTVALGLVALIALVGAGCAKEAVNTEKTDQNKPEGAPLTINTETNKTSDITLTVEKLGAGQVKLSWQANGENKTGWRLMNASKPQSENPFWQKVPANTKEFEWTGLPSGKRYFRICEWTGTECGQTSNEVESEIE
jgi:hypothetical protein